MKQASFDMTSECEHVYMCTCGGGGVCAHVRLPKQKQAAKIASVFCSRKRANLI